MDFFKKAQKKLESILHEKNLLNISKINDSTDNKVFIEIFSNIFIGNKLKVKEDYLDKLYVLNFSEESNNIIDFKGIKQEKIINFKNRSILSIEFSLEFINLVNEITNFNCTNEKESISNKKSNMFYFHVFTHEINSDLIYVITILYFVLNHKNSLMDIYSSISLKKNTFIENFNFEQICSKNHFNIVRYLNYIENLQNTNFMFEKMYLDSIIINGAPALSNNSDATSTYLTINENSYYIPILRIFSNDKQIFSSNKEDNIKVYYSELNSIKFKINLLIFGDIKIEILHQSILDNKKKYFKLFEIKFNTLFNENLTNFTKNNIDDINLDLRYPEDFSVGLIYDELKKEKLGYDEVLYIKNKINKIILNQYEKNDILSKSQNTTFNKGSNNDYNKQLFDDLQKKKNDRISNETNKGNEDRNINTKHYNDSNSLKNDETDEGDDEDLDKYLKELEERAK